MSDSDPDPEAGDPGGPDGTAPTPSEVTSGRLLRNTVVNGLANASSAIVTIVLTPLLLDRLGAESYGLWILALSLTFTNGYLALADIGLTEASVKLIAEARARGDVARISEVTSTTIATFAGLGTIIGIAVALIAPLLVSVFGVDPSLERTARVLFTVMAFEVVLELPTAALRSVIEGLQRYAWLRGIDVAGRLLWGAAVVVAVLGGAGVVALGVLMVATTAVRAVATAVVAKRLLPGLEVRPKLATRRTFRETAGYGTLVGGLRFLSVIYAQMDRAIIAIAVSVAAVASYEVIFRIQSIATLVLVMASSAVLPAAAYNAVRAETNKQRELYLRGTKYAMAMALPVCLAAILYARILIVAWVGEDFADMTGAARLFLVFPILASVNQVGVAMLIGLGRARPVLVLQALAVGVNLVVSIALAGPLGINGVVIGTLVGGTVAWLPYLVLLIRTFAVAPADWMRRVLFPNLPGVVAQVAVGLATLHLVADVDRLLPTLAIFAASVAVNLAAFVWLGVGREERRHLIGRFIGRDETPSATARPT